MSWFENELIELINSDQFSRSIPIQYGPMTMIVLASGHQFRCIPWVQMGTFKERDWLMWIKMRCIEYILWGIPTIESTFDVAHMVIIATVKHVPVNSDALLNIQAC